MAIVIRLILKLAYLGLTLWVVASLALFAIMWLPPGPFASVVAKIPQAAMKLLPFQTLWGVARAGRLSVGDPAPDFDLEKHDKTGQVRLADFMRKKPVVLVFGSYT